MSDGDGPVTLVTERLVLRELEPEDLSMMVALGADQVVRRFMTYLPGTEIGMRAWLDETIAHNRRRPRSGYNVAIVGRADGRFLGWIGIGRPSRPSGGYERELDFGYALLPPFWNQGYMTEALRALLDFAFATLAAQRVFGECDGLNVASARVMENAGMRREAELEEWDQDGNPSTTLRFGLLEEEWRAVRPGSV